MDIKKEYEKFINIQLPETWYKSSLLSLNYALDKDGRGMKGGRFLVIIGDKSTGKTTLASDFIANAQKDSHLAAYIDVERTYDLEYAERLGVNIDDDHLIKVYPDNIETAMSISEWLIKEMGVKVLVFDSVAAGSAKIEEDKDYNDNEKTAVSAGLFTRFVKRMTPLISNEGALIILINQFRDNLSPMARTNKKAFGARAISYHSSATIELTRTKNNDDNAEIQIFTEKNKLSGKERAKITTLINFDGTGFDVANDIIDLALQFGIVKMKGNTSHIYIDQSGVEIKAQGRKKAKLKFPLEEIKSRVIEQMNTTVQIEENEE